MQYFDGEEEFAQTESGGENVDDGLVRDFIAAQFASKKFLNAKGKAALDFVCRLSIIPRVGRTVLPPEKRLIVVIQSLCKKELATGNANFGSYKLLNITGKPLL